MKSPTFCFLFFRFCFVSLFSIFYFLISNFASAATLYLEPSQGEYRAGDTFLVDINIDTEGKCINAVDVRVNFPQNLLQGASFSRGESILLFWTEQPVINQELGLVSFSGGIPGGYCGILQGDPRRHSHLGRIIFQAREPLRIGAALEARIRFEPRTQVLLNDGLGTPAQISKKDAVLSILSAQREDPRDEWSQKIKADNIAPEPFELEIKRDEIIFDGKYFVIFSTTDKQTGLAYFEIQEGVRAWARTESPHLLEDQSLRSIIKVRAIDMAGNERIATFEPRREFKLHAAWLFWGIIMILAIVIASLIFWRKK